VIDGSIGKMKYELKQAIKNIYTAIHVLEGVQKTSKDTNTKVRKPLKNSN
jgi:hypothetical protein